MRIPYVTPICALLMLGDCPPRRNPARANPRRGKISVNFGHIVKLDITSPCEGEVSDANSDMTARFTMTNQRHKGFIVSLWMKNQMLGTPSQLGAEKL